MKIDGRLSRSDSVKSGSKTTRSKGGEAEFAQALASGEPEPVGATSGVSPLGGIEGLFALQEVGDGGADARAQAQGEAVLDRLEDLKQGLLLGQIAPSKLTQLARLSADAANTARDPRLKEVLQEIELRAQVELAKLGIGDP